MTAVSFICASLFTLDKTLKRKRKKEKMKKKKKKKKKKKSKLGPWNNLLERSQKIAKNRI